MKSRSAAFTLVEILLVASLTAVLSTAVFHSFSNALKLWTKAESINKESDVIIFLDKLEEDLRAFAGISGLVFKGDQTQISFPAIVMIKADPRSSRFLEGTIDQIGMIRYQFDANLRSIFRQQANYGQAIRNKWQNEDKPIVSNITELNFLYQDAADKKDRLKSDIAGAVPAGVFIDVRFVDDNGEHRIQRYLPIPVGG